VARRQAESAALDAWRQFVDALAEDQRRRLEEKDWEGFFDSLSEAQRGCLNDTRSAERERRTPREVRFDSQLVARWVFTRVMDLGWRPERFAEFDHSIAASNSRTDHGAERIGKKYQWIALHEALARVADHCVYKPLWSSEASHASHAYEGPWQLGRRDIDPSLLPAPRPRADHAEASPQAWWVQASAQFPQPCADNARRAWVLEQSDLPDPSRLIDVTDPTKHRWLAVEGFYEWEEDVPVEVPRSSADRCVLWCRVSGYIVRRADLSPLLRWLGERKSTEWCMPENTSGSRYK